MPWVIDPEVFQIDIISERDPNYWEPTPEDQELLIGMCIEP